MEIGRDIAAAEKYRAAGRGERREMIMYAQCDDDRTLGLLRVYQARSFRDLARVRCQSACSRPERLKRKSEFFRVLAVIAGRQERITQIVSSER